MLHSNPSFKLTPASTRLLLDELGHHPIRKWGQNFLVDSNIVDKSLRLADVQEGDTVVEIGPGLGCLSASLLNAGAYVYAVEIDKRLAHYLRENFKDQARFNLFEGDAVSNCAGNKPSDDKAWKIVANLPYAISTPWLEHILRMKHLPTSLTLMLQREAASRLTAKVGSKHYGAVTISLQMLYEVGGEHAVARQCFYPIPGVDSQLLNLKRKAGTRALSAQTRETIRAMFTQRRKQIGALVKTHLSASIASAWLEQIQAAGFTRKTRPEALPLPCWQALNHLLCSSNHE